MSRFILVLILLTACYAEEELKAEARDSYIDAYHESHGSVIANKNDRESKYSPFYENTGPEQAYGPPHPGYPEPSYPSSNYGPPVYGPPNYMPRYRAFPSPFYGVPHAMMGILDKFHLKLDIFTILKIILKLVIFKKIVGFIAIICLLLFIPKFKVNKGEDEMEEETRSFKNDHFPGDARLNRLTQFVLGAIEKYSGNTNATNERLNNFAERMFRKLDDKLSYQRLFTMYTNKDS